MLDKKSMLGGLPVKYIFSVSYQGYLNTAAKNSSIFGTIQQITIQRKLYGCIFYTRIHSDKKVSIQNLTIMNIVPDAKYPTETKKSNLYSI